jgi:hypothetical protein
MIQMEIFSLKKTLCILEDKSTKAFFLSFFGQY